MVDGLTLAQQNDLESENLLKLVWKDGKFVRRSTLAEIRARVQRVGPSGELGNPR